MNRRVLFEVGQDIDCTNSSNNDNDRSPDHDVGDMDENDALDEKREEPDGVQEVETSPQEHHYAQENRGRHEESCGVQQEKGSSEGHSSVVQEEEKDSKKAYGVQEGKGSLNEM